MGRVLYLGPSWHGPSFMWAELVGAELVLVRVVLHPVGSSTREDCTPSLFKQQKSIMRNSSGSPWNMLLLSSTCNLEMFLLQFIVPTQPIVTSLWKSGQPCCRSKINRPHSGKLENLFFYLVRLFFRVKANMFIFEFHFCINHCNCHDTSMRRLLEK